MAFTKITNAELNSRGATTLPNVPAIGATALKQEFDAPAKQVVAPKVNNLIDELQASTAAADLGAVAPTGRTGTSVQSVLDSLSSDLGTAEAQSHAHPNKAVIDKFADDGTGLTYDGNPVGAVTSVNSQTGAVVLTASDVGALPASTPIPTKTSDLTNDSGFITSGDIPAIPTKTSDLTNDSNFVADASYVHTDNNYDATAKAIVDGATAAIAAKSTVAWNQIDTTGTKIAEIIIDGVKTDVKATGGGSADAYKTIDAGGQSFVASGADTFKINAGSNVTITPLTGDKGIKISAAGGGTSTGDMLMNDYDRSGDVKSASSSGNGIKDYVASAISGKADTSSLATVATTGAYSDLSGKPTLATVATSGSYNDLTNKPTPGTGIAINNNVIAVDADNTPTENSEKPVKSKGVYSALESSESTQESLLKSTVGWNGKNLLKPKKASGTSETGISYAVDENGCKLNGTASSNFFVEYGTITLPQGSYVYTDEVATSNNTYFMNVIPNPSTGSGNLNINNKPFTFSLSTETTLTFMAHVRGGQTVNNLLFKPMIRDASITDDTYEPYHESVEEEITQIYADNGVLGAKNLLPYPYTHTTKTDSGITFTDNGDGTITADGTASADVKFYCMYRLNSLEVGKKYILSGCPSGGSDNTYRLAYTNNTDYAYKDFGEGVEITGFASTYTDRSVIIWIKSGVTVNNLVFKPMIRLASDPDDTYVPYAMTNRELTEKVESIYKTATADSNGETVTFTNVDTSKSYSIEADLGTSWDGPSPSYTNVKITGTTLIYTLANANAGQLFRLIDLKR